MALRQKVALRERGLPDARAVHWALMAEGATALDAKIPLAVARVREDEVEATGRRRERIELDAKWVDLQREQAAREREAEIARKVEALKRGEPLPKPPEPEPDPQRYYPAGGASVINFGPGVPIYTNAPGHVRAFGGTAMAYGMSASAVRWGQFYIGP